MMNSNRPYLLRALNEWILDNKLTPHILVDTSIAGVQVPADFIEDDKIVLNISPGATRDLLMTNEYVMFNARFNGTAMSIEVPMRAIMAIYAQENGQGMIFPEEEQSQVDAEEPQAATPAKAAKSHLTLVK